jgi:hypothetical protein
VAPDSWVALDFGLAQRFKRCDSIIERQFGFRPGDLQRLKPSFFIGFLAALRHPKASGTRILRDKIKVSIWLIFNAERQ